MVLNGGFYFLDKMEIKMSDFPMHNNKMNKENGK